MPKRYEYVVAGVGPFPLDMLRYDAAYPATGDAVDAMQASQDRSERGPHRVLLRSHQAPTGDRWFSFLWAVDRSTLREYK